MKLPCDGTPIGLKDKNGTDLVCGDIVRYDNEGAHTKKEYWNPVYRIVYRAPAFTLEHIGGGKDGGSHDFILRCGGGNGDLEKVDRLVDALKAKVADPAQFAESLRTELAKQGGRIVFDDA